MTYQGNSLAELYYLARKDLLNAPEASPRGLKTKEILHASFELTNPRMRLYSHQLRKFNLPFAICEALMLFVEEDRLDIYKWANKTIEQFSDDGYLLYGAYGTRIHTYIEDVVEKLRKDPDSRQAMLTIARTIDLTKKTKNFPCTIALQFLIRNNKLQMHTYMRSNDFFWGWQYDMFMFTVLQEVVANELGIELGSYFHTTTSLHVYERHFDLLSSIDLPTSHYCSAPYDIKDATNAALLYTFLAQGADPYSTGIGINGQFEDVLRSYAIYKKGYSVTVSVPDWAKPFLHYLDREGA
jgi:thymidylate synthase